jgi:hypothetical protein
MQSRHTVADVAGDILKNVGFDRVGMLLTDRSVGVRSAETGVVYNGRR